VNTSLLHRRRIERFAQLLEESTGARPQGHSRSSADAELNELVTFSNDMVGETPEVTMRASAREDIRAFLMATAVRDGIGVTARETAEPAVGRARVDAARRTGSSTVPIPRVGPSDSRNRRSRARAAVLIGLAVGTLALSGISAASVDALPGDTLYGLKRSSESAQLALAGSNVDRGNLYLNFARLRLSEATSVKANSHQLNLTLNDMDKQTRAGIKLLFAAALSKGDTRPLDAVEEFLASQTRRLSSFPVVGPDHSRMLDSIGMLGLYGQRSTAIRTAIGCHLSTSLGTDTLGVRPPACQESTPVTPTPSHGGTGKSGSKGTPHTRTGSAATASNSASVGPAGISGGVTGDLGSGVNGVLDGGVAPSASASTDGGLLGSIGHILSGLLGH
jgi:hypothetical protein